MTDFEAWVHGLNEELEKKLKDLQTKMQQLGPMVIEEQKQAAFGEAAVRLGSATRVYACLEAARAIGKTLLPQGTAKDVIDLARFVYEAETDMVASNVDDDEDDDDDVDEGGGEAGQGPGPGPGPGPSGENRNGQSRQQRRHQQQQQQQGRR